MMDKKAVSAYKNTLKSMITIIQKYGVTAVHTECTATLYHYIKGEEIFPIMLVDQIVSPWSNEINPAKLFISGVNFPSDVDLTSEKPGNLSKSYICGYSVFKEHVENLKSTSSVSINGDEIDWWADIDGKVGPEFTAFKLYKPMKLVIDLARESGFRSIVDESSINKIVSELSVNSTFMIEADDLKLNLFTSVLPVPFERLDYAKHNQVTETDIVSSVYLRYYVKDLIVSTFYKYLDILEYDTKTKKENENDTSTNKNSIRSTTV